MVHLENSKFGKLAFISENDGTCLSAKDYLIHYLHEQLKEEWHLEVLILNQKKPFSSWMRQCNPIVFDSPYPVLDRLPFAGSSELIESAFRSRRDFSLASPLHQYLTSRLNEFDGFVFIGLSPAVISLLPLTNGKNCAIPLLEPDLLPLLSRNPALQFALLDCENYLCHSEKEAAVLSSFQPHAEIRAIPIMMDLEFVEEKSRREDPMPSLPDKSILLLAERMNPSVRHFADQLNETGLSVVIALDSITNIRPESPYLIISVDQLYAGFDEVRNKIKSACVFMFKYFFSIFYNLCQLHIPIFVPGSWRELLDGDGVYVLSFEEKPNVQVAGKSFQCIPYGYHSYHYYSNYMTRFISEWCVDTRLRNSSLSLEH
jgi:hypothetical protein